MHPQAATAFPSDINVAKGDAMDEWSSGGSSPALFPVDDGSDEGGGPSMSHPFPRSREGVRAS